MGNYSIRGVTKKIQDTQDQLQKWVTGSPSDRPEQFRNLQKNIQTMNAQLNQELNAKNLKLDDFSITSQKMIGWFRFLADPAQLSLHLNTIVSLHQWIGANQKSAQPLTRVQLYNSATLYRVVSTPKSRQITIHQGFCGAPEAILKLLAAEICGDKKAETRKILQDYARSETFRATSLQAHAVPAKARTFTRGKYHDLETLFEKVNQAYFAGAVRLPAIAWSPRKTKRRFGSYHFEKDQILISKTLDQRKVPAFVVEFVLYHELLHRLLGFKKTEKQKIAHTGEFRKREREFARHSEAQDFINRLAAPVRRSTKRKAVS